MIRNLVIQNIPKDEESLRKVLQRIGDLTWVQEGISEWASCDKTDMIFYDEDCDCYIWSNQGKKPINPNLVWKTYEQVVSK